MRSLWRTLGGGLVRDIALVCVADCVVGVSFGALAVAGGLPGWVPIAMSVLVFAGGAQFSAVAIVLSGGGAVAAVATGLVLNSRLLPFGFAIGDVLGAGRWARLVGSHVLIDESVAFVVAQREPEKRVAAFWTCGVLLFVTWNLGVLAGVLAGGAIGNTDVFGLDAAFPAVLIALVMPSLRDAGTARAAATGGVIAMATTPFLPPGLPILLALAGLLVTGKGKGEAR
jgi:4-azaleucine resistance transporter AzlC